METSTHGEPGGRQHPAGVTMSDVLTLPDPLRQLVTWMMRRGEVRLVDLVEHTAADEPAVRGMVEELMVGGFVQAADVDGEVRYQVRLNSRPARRSPARDIWKALDG